MAVAKTELTIIIEQLKLSQAKEIPGQGPYWPAKIHIFDRENLLRSWETTIRDPLNDAEHQELTFYLNEILTKRSWQDQTARDTSDLIRRYSHTLLESLQLRAHWNQTLQPFAGARVKIEVLVNKTFFERGDGENSPVAARALTSSLDIHRKRVRPFHCLHWELLEDLKLWSSTDTPLQPTYIRVRRRIEDARRQPGESTRNINLTPIRSMSHGRPGTVFNTFRILLVVARSTSKGVDAWSPTVIPTAVLRIQDYLRRTRSRRRVIVKIVRPGSFDRLKSLLKEDGRFNVVHFDMHGRVSPLTSKAELQFNEQEKDQLSEQWVSGEDIARLMIKHHIHCVIVGACKSAHAEAEAYANLAWVLVRARISNVLAMSYNMVDTMSEQYFNTFYQELFVEQRELSEAAQAARMGLLVERARYHYSSAKWREVDDWFVPVVYSDGRPFYAEDTRLRLWGVLNVLRQQKANLISSAATAAVVGITWLFWVVGHRKVATTFASLFLLGPALATYLFSASRVKRSNRFLQALKISMEDKTNILRLESELYRSRKVYFYDALPRDRDALCFLGTLIPIWERTNFVRGVVRLDAAVFGESFGASSWYAELRIRIWRSLFRHSEHAPRLIVVIENVHLLYKEEADETTSKARGKFEDWIRRTFASGSSQSSQPYLIMTALSNAGKFQDRPQATTIQIKKRFAKVGVLDDMSVTMFSPTDSRFIIARSK